MIVGTFPVWELPDGTRCGPATPMGPCPRGALLRNVSVLGRPSPWARSLGAGPSLEHCEAAVDAVAEGEARKSAESGEVTEEQIKDVVTSGAACAADAYCAQYGVPPGVCGALASEIAGPIVSVTVEVVGALASGIADAIELQNTVAKRYGPAEASAAKAAACDPVYEMQRAIVDQANQSLSEAVAGLLAAAQGLGWTPETVLWEIAARGVAIVVGTYDPLQTRPRPGFFPGLFDFTFQQAFDAGARDCQERASRVGGVCSTGYWYSACGAVPGPLGDAYRSWATALIGAVQGVAARIAQLQAQKQLADRQRAERMAAAAARIQTAEQQIVAADRRNRLLSWGLAAAGAGALFFVWRSA